MTIVYEATRFRFEPDPRLTALILEKLSEGPSSIQNIIGVGMLEGFDGRASAMELGIMLMDKVVRPCVPTSRVSGSTVVELVTLRHRTDVAHGH